MEGQCKTSIYYAQSSTGRSGKLLETGKISLSPRLQTIANWVEPDSLLADIGTDHGYLPLSLLQTGKISHAIAADLNEGPLDRAKSLSQHYQIPLDLRLSNGLEKISPSEVDTITIAGMGGLTIAGILAQWQHQTPWNGTFLLQPMSTQYDLRLFLLENHYHIQKEQTVREGNTYYSVLAVKTTASEHPHPYTEGELWVGRHSTSHPDPLRKEFLQYWAEKTNIALKKLPPQQTTRQDELLHRFQAIQALEQELS